MNSIASPEQSLLLELRTAAGAVYLRPSRFERLRLRWTFRHFHMLPAQLLKRRDQRLIDRLCQTAVVTPVRPVPSDAILGVVEASEVRVLDSDFAKREPWDPRWGRLGAVALTTLLMAGLLVTVHAQLYRVTSVAAAHVPFRYQPVPTAVAPLLASSEPVRAVASVAAPSVQHAKAEMPVAVKPARAVIEPPVSGSEAVPLAAETRLITELPAGRFARPVVTQNTPSGEVVLSASIAPDGSVQRVTTLHGDPNLADAGMRAVRRWRYAPYGSPGEPIEEQTRIKMIFFGPDAVSIAVER